MKDLHAPFLSITIYLCFFLQSPIAVAQTLTGAEVRFSDNFSEWNIATNESNVVGDLRRRWLSGDNWTIWDYRIGEHTGQVKLKWNGNLNEWEIRGDNQLVDISTQWRNDFRQWRIRSEGQTLVFGTRQNNSLWDWELKEEDYGYFGIYATWEEDPRTWVIVDESDDTLSLPVKMAMVFIALFHSTFK